MTYSELVKLALEARENAYAPYSNWKVGAALLTKDGKVYKGCNVEISSFSPTICAERVALFKAVSEGVQDFKMIAIVGGNKDEGVKNYCAPCGVCRQALSEFCDPDSFEVIVGIDENTYYVKPLRELIPDITFVKTEGEWF